jgi:hypothetical protein
MLSQPSESSDDVVADIRARLGHVCDRYSPEEFTALVRRIAAVQAKYEARRAESFFGAARDRAAERQAARVAAVTQRLGPPRP